MLLIKLRRQQADLNSVREHTVAQLMQLNLDGGHNPKVRATEVAAVSCRLVVCHAAVFNSPSTCVIHYFFGGVISLFELLTVESLLLTFSVMTVLFIVVV